MADFGRLTTDKAHAIACIWHLLRHWSGRSLRETRWAKWAVWMFLVVPEWIAKFVRITFEAQLLSKFAIFVFEF